MAATIDATVPAPFQLPPLPETVNHTPWPAQNFLHVDPEGDVFHVLVCRTTYSLRGMQRDGDRPSQPILLPGEQQPPLVTEDRYEGLVNVSSVLEESDFAPYKPLCDVLLVNAQGHAPEGQALPRWSVGFRFGEEFSKVLQVTGPRQYERRNDGDAWRLSDPVPTTRVPITYQLAFGGPNVVAAHAKPPVEGQEPPQFYFPNPIGTGRWGGKETKQWIEREIEQRSRHPVPPAPNEHANFSPRATYNGPQIEEHGRAFQGDEQNYPVVGFGPVSRWWQPRHRLAGTHDEQWKARQWPKSPKDHDYRYWNCAPEDQQIPYPQGGEEIALANLTPPVQGLVGPVRFLLPEQPLSALVRMEAGPLLLIPMSIDTIVIDVGRGMLSVVRRVLIPSSLNVRKLELGTWRPGEPDSAAAISIPGATPHHPETV